MSAMKDLAGIVTVYLHRLGLRCIGEIHTGFMRRLSWKWQRSENSLPRGTQRRHRVKRRVWDFTVLPRHLRISLADPNGLLKSRSGAALRAGRFPDRDTSV